MARAPFIGRLYWREYLALFASLIFVLLEGLIRIITLGLPQPIIRFCYNRSRNVFNLLSSSEGKQARSKQSTIVSSIANASDFVDLCSLFGYYAEEHVVQTGDGYLLGLHRLGWKKDQEGRRVNAGEGSILKPVVYMHHGLLMNSEVWDQFAFHDIPDSIDYILATTSQPSLSYVGFSQGTAQAFATLSIHPTLNDKVDVFIALAPAMSPAGLHNGVVDALIKASPDVLFLAFGRRSILSSATLWQAILYPPIFVRLIDMSLAFLFNWTARNITVHQKLAAYPHLYSFTSTKSVVHWFQIIRNKSFQMYDDDTQAPLSLGAGERYYKVAKFPTRNIKTPIVLVYGGSDSLVDINVMLRELPKHTVAKEIPHFEHLDFLWAEHVDTLVFPQVYDALEAYSGRDHYQQKYLTNGRALYGGLGRKFAAFPGNESSSSVPADMSGGDAAIYHFSIKSPSTSTELIHHTNPGQLPDQLRDTTLSNEHYIDTSMSDTARRCQEPTTPVSPSPVVSRSGQNQDDVQEAKQRWSGSWMKSDGRHRRSGSTSSSRSTDSAIRFSGGGISVGAARAIVGGISGPTLAATEHKRIFSKKKK
ncbi:MAG: hypothetical protein Q9208_003046 [Pyrenodesmia sp. 3 TL-2023]